MRLLILTPEYDGVGGGICTHFQTLAPALREQGVEVHVLEGSGSHAEHDPCPRTRNGVSVETLDYARLKAWDDRFSAYSKTPLVRRHLAAAWAMWEQSGFGEKYDIVDAVDYGLLFVPPAIDASRPLTVQCWGSMGQIATHDPLAGEEIEGILVRLFEHSVMSVAQTVETSSSANALFWRVEAGRDVEVALPPFRLPPAISDPLTDRGLVVGRVQRWKGPHVLCAAIRRLGEKAPQFDWVGRDTVWEDKGQSSNLYLSSRFPDVWKKVIRHRPQMSRAEVFNLQATALFNLVPSTWDVFNFTAVEAMASARPTIVSTGAGACDLVVDGANGFLFSAGDADDLASCIERVLSFSHNKLNDIGRAGRSTISKLLNPNEVARQKLENYKRRIEAFRSEPPARPSAWLCEICRPMNSSDGGLKFLDTIPLRGIVGHIMSRTLKKFILK